MRVLFTYSSPPSIQLSMMDSNIVADTFAQRLRASDALKVETADHMSREAARKRAKAEEAGRFIIWLELQTSGMGVDTIGVQQPNPEDLRIQYIIYEPGTGATRADGNVYLRPIRSLPGGRTVPNCYPNRYYGLDGALIAGAIDTASRVFGALSIPDPPLCP